MTTGQAPTFTMSSRKWLRDKGIRGDTAIRLVNGGLEMTGAEGGALCISGAQIRRLRIGWRSIKYGPFFLTSFWLEGEEKPLALEHRGFPVDGYAAVVRGLAAQLARVDGVKRLHRGSSIAAALEILAPMSLLFLAAVALAIFALGNEDWWARLISPGVTLAFVFMGAATAFLRWPRPVRDLEEFNRRVAPLP